MAQNHRSLEKFEFIPKTRVEPWRRVAYLSAFREAKRREKGLKFSEWIRRACDLASGVGESA
jgi:hypothetical protein